MTTPPNLTETTVINAKAAHIADDGRIHEVIEHLEQVGILAGQFASAYETGSWAGQAGRWHDLGKYSANFQQMIYSANGMEAHIEGDATGPRDHSTAGAIHAKKTLTGSSAIVLAFVIAGHHAGLADLAALQERTNPDEKNPKYERYTSALAGGAPKEILDLQQELLLPSYLRNLPTNDPQGKKRHLEMWIRMLFSALCDADFLDTEAFFDSSKSTLRENHTRVSELLMKLNDHMQAVEKSAQKSVVNDVRRETRASCTEAGQKARGVFSLTVPTGGGKTLAAMQFALNHAVTHGLRRVIVGIPFTSIIEQSAGVYEGIFGPNNVLAHHSAIDPSKETAKSRLASENWDVPIVVTTTVQLIESLFSNRPSRCRKLHRIANSVIILDEAQSLPPHLLEATLDALTTLVSDYGCSIVISTATQPALKKRHNLPFGFAQIEEIVPRSLSAFERLKRVEVIWPDLTQTTASDYSQLAAQLADEKDGLAIVHLRKDARDLCERIDGVLGDQSTLHLSALMCPEHRTQVLSEIKKRKSKGVPVRLVATQLVEAGVDLDFAVVFRALGGMDALAQAAGRCNREGRLNTLGQLRVFVAPTRPPLGVPRLALAISRSMLEHNPQLDLFAPQTHLDFFRRLYSCQEHDALQIQEARTELNFATVASKFKLIENDWAAPIVVPFHKATDLVRGIEKYGVSRNRLRSLQRYMVNVPKTLRDQWLTNGQARLVGETVVVLDEMFAAAYNERFGLMFDRVGQATPDSLIVDE